MTPDTPRLAAASGWAQVVTALLVLVGAGGFLRYARATGKLYLVKEAAPLVRPLSDFDAARLEPFIVREKTQLPDDIVEELGTRYYIQWSLADPTGSGDAWLRTASLFVTYYTGIQDQVPHVPEECYFQGASSQQGLDDLSVRLVSQDRDIPVRRLVFVPPHGGSLRMIVYYTFIVNGDFYCDRLSVRRRMMNESERYLYYSKIELLFRIPTGDGIPSAMDDVAARLLNQSISELVKTHIPDVAAMERQRQVAAR